MSLLSAVPRVRWLIAMLVALGVAVAGCEAKKATTVAADKKATMIVTGARIWTGDEFRPWAEAMAVRGDTILAVGENDVIAALAGEGTTSISIAGAMVVPGFIDTHVHMLDGGEALASVQLRDADSQEEFSRRFAEHVKKVPPGEWILGGAWDHELWGGELPTAAWIDAVTPDNPVWVFRLDGHMALANSLAMQLAGIDATVADVAGGEIDRDVNGKPLGVFKDNAMTLIGSAVTPATAEQRDRQLEAAMNYLASEGVTTAHDMATFESLQTYRRAHQRLTMITRVYSVVPLPEWQALQADIEANGRGDEWLKIGGLKAMMDGSLGSHTAAFLEPFTDTPDNSGLLIHSLGDMRQWISGADAAGLHLIVHAIGDKAIRDLLDIYRDVAAEHGARDRRFRVEHAQHIHPDDMPRFAEQGIIASMQPYHAIDDGRWAERVIGRERAQTTYAFRSLIDSGARVAFGSDWFVAPASPRLGIYAAVMRRTLDGANPDGWVPGEKVNVEQALTAYTAAGAYASYDEDQKGRLKPGMLADFVVLDKDLTAIPPEQIPDVKILRTVVGGKIVYEQ